MDTIVPGALAAFVVDCAIFPLDTIKSRVQAQDYAQRYPNRRGLYRGLWQGFGPVVVATLPAAAVFFTAYERAKEGFTRPSWVQNDSRILAGAHALASTVAEMSSCVLLTPAETVKQQMQVAKTKKQNRSQLQLLRRVAAELTPGSLVRGYWALVGRNLPFTAMQFPMYEYIRGRLSRALSLPARSKVKRAAHQIEGEASGTVLTGNRARKEAHNVQRNRNAEPASATLQNYLKAGGVSGASAAIAGGISAWITTPLDLLKTRVMLAAGSGNERPAISTLATEIYQRQGLRGFMRGAALRSSWTAIGAGVYLSSYEFGREWWSKSGQYTAQDAIQAGSTASQDVIVTA